MNICLQSLNIASIVVCAQVSLVRWSDLQFNLVNGQLVDIPFQKILCNSALSISSVRIRFCFALNCFRFVAGNSDSLVTWYGSSEFDITLGYLLVTALCIPMGMVNLDENIKFQWISFFGLVFLMADFRIQFESPFYWGCVPVIGSQFTQVVSVCIFSWAFVMLVPSWANEKKDHVSINKTIWTAAVTSTIVILFLFCRHWSIFLGICGDWLLVRCFFHFSCVSFLRELVDISSVYLL